MHDLSHPEQLPIIARHLDDRFHIPRSWVEAKAVSGETPDVFSVVERAGSWYGGEHYFAGSTIVSEFKSSVADLRADAAKPWRGGQVRSLGDWRLYWLNKAGPVRPEHVDEGIGWGVVMFDDHDAELVRTPEIFHRVNTWAQTALIVRLMGRDAYMGKDARRGRGQSVKGGSKYVSEAVKLLQQGPLTAGQLRKLLDYPQSAAKLSQELMRSDKIQNPLYPGGNFEITG